MNNNCKQIKMAFITASVTNIRREECISSKSDQCTVRLEKKKIAILANEYARWRSDKY